jgi:exodeoxyribonuclease V alpha subunit
MNDQIFFKGLIEYLNWYINIPKNTCLDISSEIDLNNLNSIFNIDLKYFIPESFIEKLKTSSASLPLKPCSFLLGLGFSPKITESIIKFYGPSDHVVNLIENNPYDLLVVEGINFKKIDKISLEIFNIKENDPRRLKSFIIYHLDTMCQKNGHLFIELEKFINSKFEVSLKKEDVKNYLKELIFDKKIFLISKKLYTSNNYNSEQKSAEFLASILEEKIKFYFFKDIDPIKYIASYENLQTQNIEKGVWKNLKWKNDKFELSEKQKEAVKKFFEEKILIITGLPGTGKSTVTKALVDVAKSRGLRITLMAPTGIAAKRLAEVTNFDANTIHKKLGFDGVSWNKKKEDGIQEDIIIVDEFSMVDQNLFFKLLSSLPKKEFKLVLVGDSAQLPSVAPGNVLSELINSKKIAHVALDKIFRQDDTSDIVVNAHLINSGNVNLISKNKDFIFIEVEEEEKGLDVVTKIIEKIKDKNFQVLSPTYKGFLGVNNLNNVFQDILNPKLDENVFKTELFQYRIDDRVMILKNDYQNEVYNGEQGVISSIKMSKKTVTVYINGKSIEYSFRDAYSAFTLDYARTIHKSQASEYDYVVIPWVDEFSIQLQRNLLYTAITRAKKKVFLVGNSSALKTAIKNNRTSKRNTIFASRLSSEIEKIKNVLNNKET